MSIFGRIAEAIMGGSARAAEAAPQGAAANPMATPVPSISPAASKSTATMTNVDVAAVLDKLRVTTDEDLDWRVSIVDLMKLVKLDSSLKARKELAKELGYTGVMNDSAKMNVWLHKQVMTKLAENGGVVPSELRD